MKTKTYQAQVKATDDGDEGTFEALVSVFGNVDHAGDRVMPGAFSKSLDRWAESGDPIPVVFSHRWDDLDAHIGKVLTAEETDDGLLVTAQLDVDEDPAAAKVHRLLKDRRIREFSFAYDVLEEDKADDGANDLLELDVIEVGPTLKGMNPDTVLVGAKRRRKVHAPLAGSVEQRQEAIREAVRAWAAAAGEDRFAYVEATFEDTVVFSVESPDETTHWQASYELDEAGDVTLGEPTEVELEATIRAASRGAKAGRVLSSKNETKLREARDAIDAVLAAVEGDDDENDEDDEDGAAAGGGKGSPPPESGPNVMDLVLRAEVDALEVDPA